MTISEHELQHDKIGLTEEIDKIRKIAHYKGDGGSGNSTDSVFDITAGDARYLKLDQTTPQIIIGSHTFSTLNVTNSDIPILQWGTDEAFGYSGLPLRMYWNYTTQSVTFDSGGGIGLFISANSFIGSGTQLTGVGLLGGANIWTLNNIFSTSVTTPQIYGDSIASRTLTLQSTSNATKGSILFGGTTVAEINEVNRSVSLIGASSRSTTVYTQLETTPTANTTFKTGLYLRINQSTNDAAKGFSPNLDVRPVFTITGAGTYFPMALNFAPLFTINGSLSPGGFGIALEAQPFARVLSGSHFTIWAVDISTGMDTNVSATGTIDNAHALHIRKIVKPQGNITNGVGIYVEDQINATNNYAIYTNTGDLRFAAAATDKIGFHGAIPVVQATTAGTASTFAANTSGIANDTATWDSYTIGQVVKALRNKGILA